MSGVAILLLVLQITAAKQTPQTTRSDTQIIYKLLVNANLSLNK